MYTQKGKLTENKKQSFANGVAQKQSGVKPAFQLVDNRSEAVAQKKIQELANKDSQEKSHIQLKATTHSKGCGCSSCNTQLVQRKFTNHDTSVTQLANGLGVLQFATCKYCGFEGGHRPGCTSKSRDTAKKEKEEEGKKQHDQSMDGRTREDQTHTQHGGDAKGRERMYRKRGGGK